MAAHTRNLTGKVAIITGSSRGIGASIALKLASHGADVVINYLSSAKPAEVIAAKARDEHKVRAITIQADVTDEEAIAKLFQAAKEQLGRVDIVMVSIFRASIIAESPMFWGPTL